MNAVRSNPSTKEDVQRNFEAYENDYRTKIKLF